MCTPLVRFAPYFTFCWGWKTITADWNKSKCKSFSLSLLWWHQSYSWFVEKLFQNCSNFCLPEIIVRLSSWYLFRPFRACVKRGRNFYHVWRKKSCYQYVFDDFPRVCTVRRRERKLPWRYMKYVCTGIIWSELSEKDKRNKRFTAVTSDCAALVALRLPYLGD